MTARAWRSALADEIRTGYWFVPTILALLAVVAATFTVRLDEELGSSAAIPGVWTGGADGARALLATAAGAIITTAGVTFSIAIVAITVATAQFGPRLLRNFLQDVGSQVSLGALLATFLYALLVLRTVRGPEEGEFVPHLSVTIAIGLTVVSVIVLIYFIHHAVAGIQVANILAAAAADLETLVRRLYPEGIGREPSPGTVPPADTQRGNVVRARRSGYVESVDGDRLVAAGRHADGAVRLLVRPGTFVEPGVELAVVAAGPAGTDVSRDVDGALRLSRQRTERQDIEFAVQQIAQVAIRALSPAYNDPFTALMALDRLATALSDLAGRPWPSPLRCDAQGAVRVVADAPAFPVLLSQAMGEIRRSGRGSLTVSVRILEALVLVGGHAVRDDDRRAVIRQAQRVLEDTTGTLVMPHERTLLERRLEDVRRAVRNSGGGIPPAGAAA